MSGVTLHYFLRKKQEETEKKEATQKKNKNRKKKNKNRKRKKKLHQKKKKTGTARKKRSHVEGKSKAGSTEKIFAKKERRIKQKTNKKNEEAEVLNVYIIM